MQPSYRRLARALTVVAVASSAVSMVPPAGAAPAVGLGAGFYDPPASVPPVPGSLLRSQRYTALLNTWGNPTRIMYSSTSAAGSPSAITGTYIEPWARWAGPGPRPLVSLAVGTIGEGDQCAPSRMMFSSLNLEKPGSVGLNYETGAINDLLAKGIAVVVTDYDGLGTPDRVHSYMNRVEQGRAVLDAARVATKVPGASVTSASKVVTYGYSQGGSASAAAVELAPSYAPELPVTAAYVGAPAADLDSVLDGVDASPIAGAIGYFLNGAMRDDAGVRDVVNREFNDVGRRMLARTAGQCLPDSLLSDGGHSTREYTVSGESFGQLVAQESKLNDILEQQRLGRIAPQVPVRVATGINDDIVPHAQGRDLAVRWCGLGGDVSYVPLTDPSWGKKSLLNHAGPLLSDRGAAQQWIVDRLTDKPLSDNCAALPSLR